MIRSRKAAPSIVAISFMVWWIVPSLIFPDRLLNSDGDLFRHIAHGDWMLRHHGLIQVDPFSFTRGGQPFIGFEYGSQLLLALVHRAAGLAGVAILAGLLIATCYALLASFLLRRGTDPLLSYIITTAAAVLGAVHWLARPHLFTLVAVVVLMFLLESIVDSRHSTTSRRSLTVDRRPLWTLPLFAIWANLHAGFLIGLILIGIYFVGHLLEYLGNNARQDQQWHMRRLATMFGCGLMGTLLTPHFVGLYRHLTAFLGESFLFDNTGEFQSPDFHSVTGKIFLLVLIGMIAALAAGRRRPTWPRLLVMLAMTWTALTAQRNIALFGVTALPLLALHSDAAWRVVARWHVREVFERDAPWSTTIPYVLALVASFGFLLTANGRAFGHRLVPNEVSPTAFPVEVVRRARAAHLDGRIFNEFVWGGYLLYAWPEQKVFIDGGTDFYGADLARTWLNIANRAPFWRDSLERWDISLVLMPTGSGLTHELLREPGWRLYNCDATAALLQRAAGPHDPNQADSLLASCTYRPATP